jgi:hypothetical protein
MHVITHGVGHRGQVSAVMLLNEKPPAIDGFTTYLHTAEAATRRRGAVEGVADVQVARSPVMGLR